jgi:murein DD-endopeptidase MepM/ murein hydrolase activator NlpD
MSCTVARRAIARRVVSPVGALACALISSTASGSAATVSGAHGYVAPLPPPLRVVSGFAPPVHPWDAGNRGVDLAAYAGEPVYAAAEGVVVYAGMLAGRGVISISHGAIRSTYEPVDPVVGTGERLSAGQLIGRVSTAADDCGPRGSCLHWGALRDGSYIDPMGLLRAPAVRLLPIWAALSGLFSQLRAQLQDGLGVHLTDTALGHA